MVADEDEATVQDSFDLEITGDPMKSKLGNFEEPCADLEDMEDESRPAVKVDAASSLLQMDTYLHSPELAIMQCSWSLSGNNVPQRPLLAPKKSRNSFETLKDEKELEV